MLDYVISKIEELFQVARDDYGVNPVIFLIIYLVCVPVFYYSLFRTIQSLVKKLGKEIMLWAAIFLCANIAPFIYVIFFGRNIPWWVYGIIALLIGLGILSLIMKLRKIPAAGTKDR
jgi:hypothetical protein